MKRLAPPLPISLLLSGLILVGAFAGMWQLSDLTRQMLPFQVLFFTAFAAYLVAVTVTWRQPAPAPNAHQGLCYGWMAGIALVARLLAIATPPTLSDDIFRYRWEGKAIRAGVNPYQFAPGEEAVQFLRDDYSQVINHPQQRSPYPPVTLAYHTLVYSFSPDGFTGYKVAAVLLDLAGIALLAGLLGQLRLDRRRVIVAAWSPLAILEYGQSGHHDALLVLLVLLALYLALRANRAGAGVSLGLAVAAKWVPAVTFPAFWRRWGWPGRVAFALTGLVACSPLLLTGPAGWMGILSEAGVARVNDSLFYLIERSLRFVVGNPAESENAARIVAYLLLGATALWAGWRATDSRRQVESAALSLGAYVLLAASVQSWYTLWVVPLLAVCLQAGRGRWPLQPNLAPGWLWLSGATALTHAVAFAPQIPGFWLWVRLIEYGPLALMALWQLREVWPSGGSKS